MKIKRGDICIIELQTSKGSVQRGVRPCLIIQNNVGNSCSSTTIVLPLTRSNSKHNLPTHLKIEKSSTNGLKVDSWVLGEQPVTVSIEHQVERKIGTLENSYMEIIDKILAISIGL